MKHWQLRAPESEHEWQQYYQLRWQILREPWQQPRGSEQDELEQSSYHLMLVNDNGDIAAAGRLHLVDNSTAQVRYMAVASAFQGKGAGRRVLQALERQAALWGCHIVQLNARDTAVGFYLAQGYLDCGAAAELYGIAHRRMSKQVRLIGSAEQYQQWCRQLAITWQQTIPLSQFMQLDIQHFDGNEIRCQAPLAPNINLHQTMFAGSIYSLATLTGWGLLYMQLQAAGLHGDQVLAEASVRYKSPVADQPQARCYLHNCIGDLSALSRGKKAVQTINVEVMSGNVIAAEFSGRYVVLPKL